MKIAVFGVSGRTGSLVAREALKRGWKVSGIARDKSKVTVQGAEITGGTPYDKDTVKKALEGCDAVVSTLNLFPSNHGLFTKIQTPLDFMSVSMRNATAVMKEKGIRRIVLMTALGVGDSYREIPLFFRILTRISNLKYSYREHDRQEKILEESGLDWTVVRPVMLTDAEDNLPVIYNLSGNRKIGSSITRLAVANFILDCIEKGEFTGQKPGISNK